ncbi:MAG: FAD-dependent oxidoreductase, partial [Usitatibacter sp.]
MAATLKVDVAIIGAGTAGLTAYRASRAAGARTVLIEGGPYGTTCARVGCMPSKLLIAAAEAVHSIQRAPGFGVRLDGKVRVDGREVMARVKRERDRFVGFVLHDVGAIAESDRVRGHAKFADRNTLLVGEQRIEARAFVIATGSRPTFPPLLDGLGDRLVVNDDVFAWDDLPRSVAVFGPGVIGLEIGQALTRLGVRVVVLGRGGRVGPITDPYVQRAAIEA